MKERVWKGLPGLLAAVGYLSMSAMLGVFFLQQLGSLQGETEAIRDLMIKMMVGYFATPIVLYALEGIVLVISSGLCMAGKCQKKGTAITMALFFALNVVERMAQFLTDSGTATAQLLIPQNVIFLVLIITFFVGKHGRTAILLKCMSALYFVTAFWGLAGIMGTVRFPFGTVNVVEALAVAALMIYVVLISMTDFKPLLEGEEKTPSR